MTRYINKVEKVALNMGAFTEMHGGPPHAVADAVARGYYKPWWTESRLKPSGLRGGGNHPAQCVQPDSAGPAVQATHQESGPSD